MCDKRNRVTKTFARHCIILIRITSDEKNLLTLIKAQSISFFLIILENTVILVTK